MKMIFVFGSNLAGRHGKGAALTARLEHGAIYGQAEGLMGNSYALPTCDHRFQALPIDEVRAHIARFIRFANTKPELTFQVTRVGCGLAYFTDDRIAPLFQSAPDNCHFDYEWRPWLGIRRRYWGTF